MERRQRRDCASEVNLPMFHMLCCFDLRPEYRLEDFRKAFEDFTVHLQEMNLVEASSPVGIRQSDTILDTDSERDHQYFSS